MICKLITIIFKLLITIPTKNELDYSDLQDSIMPIEYLHCVSRL